MGFCVHMFLQARQHGLQSGRRAAPAFKLEEIFGYRPAVILGAQPTRFRHAHLIKEHLVQLVLAREGDDGINLDAGCFHVQ